MPNKLLNLDLAKSGLLIPFVASESCGKFILYSFKSPSPLARR